MSSMEIVLRSVKFLSMFFSTFSYTLFARLGSKSGSILSKAPLMASAIFAPLKGTLCPLRFTTISSSFCIVLPYAFIMAKLGGNVHVFFEHFLHFLHLVFHNKNKKWLEKT